MRNFGPPWPYDCEIGLLGCMLAAPNALKSERPQHPYLGDSYQTRGDAEQRIIRDDWSRGAGLQKDDSGLQTSGALWFADDDGTGQGGIDASFGDMLILASKRTDLTIDAGKRIGGMVQFAGDGKYYLTAGRKVWVSANGLTGWSVSLDIQGSSEPGRAYELINFTGSNSQPLLYLSVKNGPYWTFDGTSWLIDAPDPTLAATDNRTDIPMAVYRYVAASSTYTDYTAAATDGSAGTAAALGVKATEHFLIGYWKPFWTAHFILAILNAVAGITWTVEYWDDDLHAWTALVTSGDGTVNATHTFGQEGNISWFRPDANWGRQVITEQFDAEAFYYVRLTPSADLTAGTTVSEITVQFNEESLAWGTTNRYLWRVHQDGTRVSYTETGGRTADWNQAIDPIGPYDGDAVGLESAGDAIYVRRTTDFSAPNADGTVVPYERSMLSNPPATGVEQAFCAWIDSLYFSKDEAFFRFTPGVGLEDIGPERLMSLGRIAGGRITAATPWSSHFLYCALRSEALQMSYLLKFGAYRQVADQNGVPTWQRFDSWNILGPLGNRTISAMSTYVDSTGQPQLVLGDRAGVLSTIPQPKGFHPLEPGSGVTFESRGRAVLPTFYGPDPSRSINVYALFAGTENLAAQSTVTVRTKGPHENSWVERAILTEDDDQRWDFSSPYQGRGVDLALVLQTTNPSVTPVLRQITFGYMQRLRQDEGLETLTIKADDGVVTLDGQWIGKTTQDWLEALEALVGAGPVPMVRQDGKAVTVLVRGIQQVAAGRGADGSPGYVVQILLTRTA